jgi:hypothetical protein
VCIRGSREVEGLRGGEIEWWLDVTRHGGTQTQIQIHAEFKRYSPFLNLLITDELLITDDSDDLPIIDGL